jgi:predicted RNase H-like nuclease (RuvC/YqgF family)
MNSFQESKNELEAAIRYAENAISSAQGTIESMEFRQEMAKKQYAEQTGREEALTKQVQELESKVQGQYDDIVMLEREVEVYTKKYNELVQQKEASSGPCGCQAYRDLEEKVGTLEHDLTAKTAQAEAWKKKYYDFKEALVQAGDPRVVKDVSGVIMNKPTMPVIPKAVAIAIFREGVAHGVSNACDEIDNANDIEINETGYTGGFEVNFTKYFDLSEHLDLDWMRDKVGDYDEASVIEALKNLCADKEFECRIHGIDDAN